MINNEFHVKYTSARYLNPKFNNPTNYCIFMNTLLLNSTINTKTLCSQTCSAL